MSAADLGLYSAARILLAAGHLSRHDLLDGLRVTDSSRRNRSVKVETRASGFHLKQSDPALGAGRHLHLLRREAKLLEAFQTYAAFSRCRRNAPRYVSFEPDAGILVTRLVRPATTLTRVHLNAGEVYLAADAAESSARALARFHEAGKRLARQERHALIETAVPLAHGIVEDAGRPVRPEDAPRLAMFRKLLADRAIVAPFPRPPADESAFSLVHGDARWDNFLVTEGGGQDKDLAILLIDWELAHWGDPLYDVAAWLVEYYRFFVVQGLQKGLTSMAASREALRVSDADLTASARAFLDAYSQARGIGRDAMRRDVALHLAALMLLVAWETSRYTKPDIEKPPWVATEILDALRELQEGRLAWWEATA